MTSAVLAHEDDDASVHMTKDEALETVAFPDSDRIERRTLFLEPEQLKAFSQRAYSKVESRLQTVYVGWKEDAVMGYAVIDTDIVRSKAATYIAILTPQGSLRDFRILAWQEPPEYEPPQRWIDRFIGLNLDKSPLRVGQGVDAISGATLSVRMLAEHVRRSLALYDVLLATDNNDK
ncbi:MAG: FMN-binding protein [Pseudomonadales bacterium]|nr:FMN-binding protein [Pseudomonadales bacterium]